MELQLNLSISTLDSLPSIVGGPNIIVEPSSASTGTPNLDNLVGPVNSTTEFLPAYTPAVCQLCESSAKAIALEGSMVKAVRDLLVPLNVTFELSVTLTQAPLILEYLVLAAHAKPINSAREPFFTTIEGMSQVSAAFVIVLLAPTANI